MLPAQIPRGVCVLEALALRLTYFLSTTPPLSVHFPIPFEQIYLDFSPPLQYRRAEISRKNRLVEAVEQEDLCFR